MNGAVTHLVLEKGGFTVCGMQPRQRARRTSDSGKVSCPHCLKRSGESANQVTAR